jgi:hypothetical protein
MTEADFFARQARLQAEARMALAQAKEMAHMQMEVERQRQKKSPITEMVRSSLEKVFTSSQKCKLHNSFVLFKLFLFYSIIVVFVVIIATALQHHHYHCRYLLYFYN